MQENTNSISQAKRCKSGNDYQQEIYEFVSFGLIGYPHIKVISPTAGVYNLSVSKKIPMFSCMQIHTNIGSIIGDTDIVIYNTVKREPIILISCKTSLRERYSQSLFNFILYRRKYPNIVSFLVTQQNKNELGTELEPTKSRILLTHENVFVFSMNNESIGGCVHPFDKLISQIKFIAGVN